MGILLNIRRIVNGSSSSSLSSSLVNSKINTSQIRSKHSHSISRATQIVSKEQPLKQFISGKAKSAGRNSKGRITIFHRGGGAKRSQRTIDLKRNTSSVGVVERIEYDPNRTSRIAVVRWEEGGDVDRQKNVNIEERLNFPPPRKLTSPTMKIKGQFSFSSIPGMIENRKRVASGPTTDYVVVGVPGENPFTSKPTPFGRTPMTNVKDVFLSAFSTSADRTRLSFVSELGLPRMAVAGAKPDFFVPRYKDAASDSASLSADDEIKKWDKDSVVWDHKIKRKAAVSWQSVRQQEMSLGLVGVAGENDSKLKKEHLDGKFTADRAPVTYILATHNMKAGQMVMNRDSSKRSNEESHYRY